MRNLLIKPFFSYLSFVLFIGFAYSTHAQVTHFQPGHATAQLSFDYFTSGSNYENNNQFIKLANGGEFSIMHINTRFQYYASKKFSFYTYGSFHNTTSVLGNVTRKNTDWPRLTFGTQVSLSKNHLGFFPEFEVSIPFKTVDPNTDEVISDDGSYHVQAGSWWQKDIWNIFTYTYLGFQYRTEDLSSLLLYKIGMEKRFQQFLFGAEVSGHTSILNDTYSDAPSVRNNVLSRVNGGSYYTYAVDPALHNIKIKGGYAFSKNFLTLFHVESTLIGQNSARGLGLWAGVEFRNLFERSAKRKKRKRRRKKRMKTFKEKTTDYDEDLFRPDSPDENEF